MIPTAGRLAMLLALISLGLTACASGSSATHRQAVQGGTLRIAIGADPDTLDPAAQTTTLSSQIVDMMAETLVTIDASGAIRPQLATSWDRSADGRTWTFTLRPGIRFQDGTPFDAQAVKFSIERLLDPGTFKAEPDILSGPSGIRDVEALDALHVRFVLGAPLASFLAVMTTTITAILSPASVGAPPNSRARVVRPVGTGPYELKERIAGDHMTLVANRTYWGPKPSFTVQTFRVVTEAASREALMRAGDVDIIYLPPAGDLAQLRQDPGLRVVMAPSDRVIDIMINTQDARQPLLRKAAVRQALNYAVDKAAIIKTVLAGAGVAMNAPMAKSLFGYCPVGSYAYDPARARSLLTSAQATGMSVKLVSPAGRYVQDIQVANAVAGYLRAVGIDVEGPATTDWPTYVASYLLAPPDHATTDLHLLGWGPGFLDAQSQFNQFWSAQMPPAGEESSYYKNDQVDTLVERANSDTDVTRRAREYCDAAKIVWNDAPAIFLYVQDSPLVTSAHLSGLRTMPNEKFVTSWMSATG